MRSREGLLADELVPGVSYDAVFDDCCVAATVALGRFLEWKVEKDYYATGSPPADIVTADFSQLPEPAKIEHGYSVELRFENGVVDGRGQRFLPHDANRFKPKE